MDTLRVGLSIIVAGAAAALLGCNVDGRRTWVDVAHDVLVPEASGSAAQHASGAEDPEEVDLVEGVIGHRTAYWSDLARLREYYAEHGETAKAGWAAFELDGLRAVKKFQYFLDAEVPRPSPPADESDPQADAMYRQARDLMRRGGHGIPALYRQDRLIEAADMLRSLVRTHPHSDKADDAAFYLGELHRQYFPGQERLAVRWYEYAWGCNPDTPYPARFQAAKLYDRVFQDRDRALELYRAVANEGRKTSEARYAVKRIRELTDAGEAPPSQPAARHLARQSP